MLFFLHIMYMHKWVSLSMQNLEHPLRGREEFVECVCVCVCVCVCELNSTVFIIATKKPTFNQVIHTLIEDTNGQLEKAYLVLFMILEKNFSLQTLPQFTQVRILILKEVVQGFAGGSVVKNLPVSAGGTGSIPEPGRSHMPWRS